MGSPPNPVNVGDLTGNTYTFIGVMLRSDGGPIEMSAVFSDETAAVFNDKAGISPVQCSFLELSSVLGIYPYDPEMYAVSVSDWTTQSTQTLTMAGYSLQGGTSITRNPQNGLHYVILRADGFTNFRLATVDVATGICTDIGSLSKQFSSITFSPDGKLYGCTGNGGSDPYSLFTIDPATAVATFRQTLGDEGGHAIAFNPDDGFVYHFSAGFMEKVDTANYAITPVTVSGDEFENPLGAVYKGNGCFYVGDWDGNMTTITTAGAVTELIAEQDDYYRGYAVVYNNPPPCSVSDISLATVSGCDDKGTNTAADDTFTADVTVTFAYAPTGGTLTLKQGNTILTTTSADLTCTTTYTFTGVQMAADGSSIVLTAEFSSGCTFTSGSLGTAPASCSCVPTTTFTACPSNQNVNVAPASCSATVSYMATANGDPAPAYTYQFSGMANDSGSGTGSGSPFGTGSTNVTVTATNDCGMATCQFTVTVNDNISPVPVCKPHTAYVVNGGVNITTSDVYQSGTDNCGMVNLVSVAPSWFGCPDVGTNNVALTINDGHGNTGTCTATVTVVDNEAPNAVCKNATINLNASGMATVNAQSLNNGSSDYCGIASLSALPASFGCANTGANPVTLTVTDIHGNTATCLSTVTVQDVSPPTALCTNITINLDANGNGSTTATAINNGSNDACGIASLSASPLSFSCANIGANTVTLTVTDNHGNTNTCTSTVTVKDVTPPTATCQGFTVDLNSGGSYALTPAMFFTGGTDGCGTVTPVSVSPTMLSCNNIGQATVTLSVSDGNGNIGTCQAIVTINPFITVTSVTTTPETCSGGNGSIAIVASSAASQLAYSINGGQSFYLGSTIPALTAGTYTLIIRAVGAAGCDMVYGTVTVGAENGTTWYKDFDNDGYSDGTTQQSCSQPAGFKAAENLIDTSGDCNDNDPDIHVGAAELCNGLDDDCNGITESTENTWTGLGDGTLWSDPLNWSDGIVPLQCQDVIVPAGKVVVVPAGFHAVGRTLDVKLSANLTIELTGTLNIEN